MNQITTRYITENGACYEQYVITCLLYTSDAADE